MKRGSVYLATPILACLILFSAYFIIKETRQVPECDLTERLHGPLNWNHQHVKDVLLSQYLDPPSSLPLNLSMLKRVKYNIHKTFYNWDFFDHYNIEFFGDLKQGFFVEAGALDGEFMSNSLWLEQNQGWSGLLIEPDPINYQYLVWKRRKAWISNTCISEKTYPKEVIFESLQRNGPHFAQPWVFRANSRVHDGYFSNNNDGFKMYSTVYYAKIQCFPLASYLLALNVTHVDYLSLDIQGSEWEVIKTLHMANIVVRVMAVEHFHEEKRKRVDPNFLTYMKSHYRLVDIDDSVNYVFVLASDPLANRSIQMFKRKDQFVNLLEFQRVIK